MPAEPETTEKPGFWKRFSKSLESGRQAYVADLKEVFGRPALDAAFWDDLEAALIAADVGVPLTERVVQGLRREAAGAHLRSPEQALTHLKAALQKQMGSRPRALNLEGSPAVVIDTAGRLHTRTDLMEELKKVRRVLERLDQRSPQEVLAVLDAHIGQNSAQQVKVFQQAIGLTGLAVTKMDGSAKAGVVLSIEEDLAVPVKLVGIGEGLDDLDRFDPGQYLDALLRMEESP